VIAGATEVAVVLKSSPADRDSYMLLCTLVIGLHFFVPLENSREAQHWQHYPRN